MNITDAYYEYLDGRVPVLKLKIDGVEVTIDPYQKPYLIDKGIVSIPLPQEHIGLLPPVDVPGDRRLGIQPYTMDCCATKDKTILKLTRQLIRAVENGSFEPGPVKV